MAKFVRVATAGNTIDGREISSDQLIEMAASYDPEVYGARIWLEHYRSLYPDSSFKAYGDVKSLKTEEIDGKTVLLAEIDPTDDLITLNKSRQKIYSSVEITPNFAKTGSAYLTGLAVTDSPASLGTEAIKFSITEVNKDDKKVKLFSEYEELIDLFTEEEPSGEDSPKLLDTIKALFKRQDKQSEDYSGAITTVAEELTKTQAELEGALDKLQSYKNDLVATFDDMKSKHGKLQEDFNTLKASLESTSDSAQRPEISGPEGERTDC